MRAVYALLTATSLLLTGCGDITIYSTTEIKHYPSRQQEKHPRGSMVFACTSTGILIDHLENGGVPFGCWQVEMTAKRWHGNHVTHDGRSYVIWVLQHGHHQFFMAELVGRSYR